MKKYFAITLLFFGLTKYNFAQNKIYLGFNISPLVSYPNCIVSGDLLVEKVDFTFGIDGIYYLDSNLFLKTGAIFEQQSFSVILSKAEGLRSTDFGTALSNYTERYKSIRLPFMLSYSFGDYTNIISNLGFEVGYLFNYEHTQKFNEKYSKKLCRLLGALTVGLGLQQHISKKYMLIIAPKYSYTFINYKKLEIGSVLLDLEFYFKIN